MIFIDYVEIVCGASVILFVAFVCFTLGLFDKD